MVEMAIGWLKSTFKILTNRPTYPILVQNSIIFATAGLMNWLKDFGGRHCDLIPADVIESGWFPELGMVASGSIRGPGMVLTAKERDTSVGGAMQTLRDTMARDMWKQYTDYLQYESTSSGNEDMEIDKSLVDTNDGGNNDDNES